MSYFVSLVSREKFQVPLLFCGGVQSWTGGIVFKTAQNAVVKSGVVIDFMWEFMLSCVQAAD